MCQNENKWNEICNVVFMGKSGKRVGWCVGFGCKCTSGVVGDKRMNDQIQIQKTKIYVESLLYKLLR